MKLSDLYFNLTLEDGVSSSLQKLEEKLKTLNHKSFVVNVELGHQSVTGSNVTQKLKNAVGKSIQPAKAEVQDFGKAFTALAEQIANSEQRLSSTTQTLANNINQSFNTTTNVLAALVYQIQQIGNAMGGASAKTKAESGSIAERLKQLKDSKKALLEKGGSLTNPSDLAELHKIEQEIAKIEAESKNLGRWRGKQDAKSTASGQELERLKQAQKEQDTLNALTQKRIELQERLNQMRGAYGSLDNTGKTVRKQLEIEALNRQIQKERELQDLRSKNAQLYAEQQILQGRNPGNSADARIARMKISNQELQREIEILNVEKNVLHQIELLKEKNRVMSMHGEELNKEKQKLALKQQEYELENKLAFIKQQFNWMKHGNGKETIKEQVRFDLARKTAEMEAKIAFFRSGQGRHLTELTKQYNQLMASVMNADKANKRYASSTEEAAASQNRLRRATMLTNMAAKNQSVVLSQLSAYMGMYFSVYGAVHFLQSMIQVGGELEKQLITLKAITQSAHEGEKLFNQMRSLALQSPFTAFDLINSTKQLSAYQIPTDQLYDTTRRLSDLSAGLGVDMNRLILAYGQVYTASVLRGQELRQFTEAGLPMVSALAQKFSEMEGHAVTAGDVFEKISKRQVPFEMVRDVIFDLTDQGGKFYQMQQKQAKSLAGRVQVLHDAWQQLLYDLSQRNSGALKGFIDGLNTLVRNFQSFIPLLKGVAAAYLVQIARSNFLRLAIGRESEEMIKRLSLEAKQRAEYIKSEATMRRLTRDERVALRGAKGADKIDIAAQRQRIMLLRTEQATLQNASATRMLTAEEQKRLATLNALIPREQAMLNSMRQGSSMSAWKRFYTGTSAYTIPTNTLKDLIGKGELGAQDLKKIFWRGKIDISQFRVLAREIGMTEVAIANATRGMTAFGGAFAGVSKAAALAGNAIRSFGKALWALAKNPYVWLMVLISTITTMYQKAKQQTEAEIEYANAQSEGAKEALHSINELEKAYSSLIAKIKEAREEGSAIDAPDEEKMKLLENWIERLGDLSFNPELDETLIKSQGSLDNQLKYAEKYLEEQKSIRNQMAKNQIMFGEGGWMSDSDLENMAEYFNLLSKASERYFENGQEFYWTLLGSKYYVSDLADDSTRKNAINAAVVDTWAGHVNAHDISMWEDEVRGRMGQTVSNYLNGFKKEMRNSVLEGIKNSALQRQEFQGSSELAKTQVSAWFNQFRDMGQYGLNDSTVAIENVRAKYMELFQNIDTASVKTFDDLKKTLKENKDVSVEQLSEIQAAYDGFLSGGDYNKYLSNFELVAKNFKTFFADALDYIDWESANTFEDIEQQIRNTGKFSEDEIQSMMNYFRQYTMQELNLSQNEWQALLSSNPLIQLVKIVFQTEGETSVGSYWWRDLNKIPENATNGVSVDWSKIGKDNPLYNLRDKDYATAQDLAQQEYKQMRARANADKQAVKLGRQSAAAAKKSAAEADAYAKAMKQANMSLEKATGGGGKRGGGKGGGKGGTKQDTWLEGFKKRFREVKEAISTYNSYAFKIGNEDWLEKFKQAYRITESEAERYLNEDGYLNFIKDQIAELRAKAGKDAKRLEELRELEQEEANISAKKYEDASRRKTDAMNNEIELAREAYDVYSKLFELTGKSSLSVQLSNVGRYVYPSILEGKHVRNGNDEFVMIPELETPNPARKDFIVQKMKQEFYARFGESYDDLAERLFGGGILPRDELVDILKTKKNPSDAEPMADEMIKLAKEEQKAINNYLVENFTRIMKASSPETRKAALDKRVEQAIRDHIDFLVKSKSFVSNGVLQDIDDKAIEEYKREIKSGKNKEDTFLYQWLRSVDDGVKPIMAGFVDEYGQLDNEINEVNASLQEMLNLQTDIFKLSTSYKYLNDVKKVLDSATPLERASNGKVLRYEIQIGGKNANISADDLKKLQDTFASLTKNYQSKRSPFYNISKLMKTRRGKILDPITGLMRELTSKEKDEIDEQIIDNMMQIFTSASQATSAIREMYAAMGDEDAAQAMEVAGSVLDGINNIFQGWRQGGPWGAAVGAGVTLLSWITSIFNYHEKAIDNRIKWLKTTATIAKNSSESIKRGMDRTLGEMTKDDKDILDFMYKIYAGRSGWSDDSFRNYFDVAFFDDAMWKNSGGDVAGLGVAGIKGYYEYLKKLPATSRGWAMQLINLKEQQISLNKQLDEEESRKNYDADAVADLRAQIDEINDQIKYYVQDWAKEVWGIDLKGWAEQFGDAIVNAFANGESAAKAFKNTVGDIMRQLVQKWVSMKIIEPALKGLEGYLFGEDAGVLNDFDLSEQDIIGMAPWLKEVEGSIDLSKKVFDLVNKALGEYGYSMKSTDNKGLSAGIQSITEDTADLLASYLNAIRAAVEYIRYSHEQRDSQGNIIAEGQLQQLRMIQENTLRNADAAEQIKTLFSSVITTGANGKRIRV